MAGIDLRQESVQHVQVETRSDYCRGVEEHLRLRREAVDPCGQRRVHGGRNRDFGDAAHHLIVAAMAGEDTSAGQIAHDLLHEQRVAPSGLCDSLR